ncbi:uncharacterized protein LOC110639689 [Hevea brasiliensis]|uniref:uncharacterized protein LOC110639689 n=1 Tax=Hevea brasiliensis TaxID=3981 RepID=UPI0025F8BD2E|nr:uncharacterized protein LOC110639689 [Hevea brasiliensis]
MVRSRHKAYASHDVNTGTLMPSEGGEPSTPQSQHSVQFNVPMAGQEPTPVASQEIAPETLQESAAVSSQDSRPSIEIEIDSLGRRRLELRSGKLSDGSRCARVITNTFKQRIDSNGVNWKAISQETKDFYWEEFKKKYFWDSSNEALIKDAWRLKAAERYKDMMTDLKNSRKKPSYISEETWENFEQYWNEPKVIRRSELYSRNRRGAGKELGRKPTPTELFVHTHTRKHDKETFVDQKSKEIHDAIVARREELTQITPDNIDENQLYLDVVGGASSSRAFSSSSSQNAALQQRIKELEKQLENERQAMTDRMDQLKLQMELQMETNMERMRSSMMEEVMRLVRGLPTPSSP